MRVDMDRITFLRKGKNRIKRTLRMNGFFYNVDELIYMDGILSVQGWGFHSQEKIETVELIVKNAEETMSIPIEYGFRRLDIGKSYGREDAYPSGIKGKVRIMTPTEVSVYLTMKTSCKKLTISIGKFQPFVREEEQIADRLQLETIEQNIAKQIEKCFTERVIEYEGEETFDIIVPIYNGAEYLPKLFEGLEKTKLKTRIFLIDDCSPDEKVSELIANFVTGKKNIFVLKNEKNIGFVGTVNRGLEQATNHVALINTDVELPEGWLERLMYPIVACEKVASSTPYSNSATIFSFPNFGKNNVLYKDLDVHTIDSQFKKIVPNYTTVPTGMGFCMGMNKNAIREIGILDDKTFSKGYGEENDWCQRAIQQGYRNVHVENLFVYHKHGGSFVSEEKQRLMETNLKHLAKRYPNYFKDVEQYCLREPNREISEFVRMLIDINVCEKKVILALDHNLGGGATAYLNKKIKKYVEEEYIFLVVRYDYKYNQYTLEVATNEYKYKYWFKEIEDLLNIVQILCVHEIWINELATFPELEKTMELLAEIKERVHADLIMLVHDYYSVCPSINLLTKDNEFCEFLEAGRCEHCYKENYYSSQYGCRNIEEWQQMWRKFLTCCTEIISFSEDTQKRMVRTFGNMPQMKLIPHEVNYLRPLQKEYKTTNTLNIGLLGNLTVHKGRNIVYEMLGKIQKEKRDVKIILIGTDERAYGTKKGIIQTGPYMVSEIPKLILEYDIDIFLIPSIWPETFSYTTEEVMKLGMPIACFDLGAPAERVKDYEKGVIIPKMQAESALDTIEKFVKEQNLQKERITEKKILYVTEYESFSSRYRLEHLQEEMLFHGYPGTVCSTEKVSLDLNPEQVAAVVIYRSKYEGVVKKIIKKAKERNIRVLFDVDDFIFDYDKIKQFTFIQNDENENYKKYSEEICQCMEVCDGIITSTENMKVAIKEKFPGKSVFVNRNVASAQMQILSLQALETKQNHSPKVVLGYFSGSKTHDRDFAVIADTLLNIMRKYQNTYLKIVGCLQLPECFQEIGERIIREPFVEWQELPEHIASIDINLMPLEDTFFHACKSENKWMEAALVLVPTIASRNTEMELVTKDGEDIVLCSTTQEWEQALEKLVVSEVTRRQIANKAYERVLQEKTTLKENEDLVKYLLYEV